MRNDVRKITEGAMMLALTGVFLLINRQFGGMLQGMMMYILPLPMVFYSMKYGLKNGWLLYFATIILTLILSTPTSLLYGAVAPLIGLIYGSGIHRKKPMHQTMVLAMTIGALTEVLALVVLASVYGIDIQAEINSFKNFYSIIEQKTGQNLTSGINLDQFIFEIICITSALTGIIEVLVTHMIAIIMMRRMRMPVPEQVKLKDYYPPKWTGYVGILGVIVYFYSFYKPLSNETYQMFLQGFGMVGVMYLVLWGILALALLLRSYLGVGKLVTWVVIFLCLFRFEQFLFILGFLYITTNFHQTILQGRRKYNA